MRQRRHCKPFFDHKYIINLFLLKTASLQETTCRRKSGVWTLWSGGGTKSYDSGKAWSSVNHSTLSELEAAKKGGRVYFFQREGGGESDIKWNGEFWQEQRLKRRNGCGRKLGDLERATTDNLTKGKKKTLPTKIFLTLFIRSTYYSISPFIQYSGC